MWEEIDRLVAKRGATLGTKQYRGLLQEMLNNLYQHVTSEEDLKKEVSKRAEEQKHQKITQAQAAASGYGFGKLKNHELGMFKYNEVTYLEDYKNNVNFSYMQSMALIAGYICGINKESTDLRIFEKTMQHKLRNTKGSSKKTTEKDKAYLLGKSKRFTLERYSAVLDYLMSIQAENCYENKHVDGHSLEYFSTINSLAEEGLLKKYVVKRNTVEDGSATGAAGAGEDLTCVSYKCNFDYIWVKEVSEKI